MRIEQITAPIPDQTPQQRYASLHRAVEKGLASEGTWIELAKVCAEIGLFEEAKSAFEKVTTSTERTHVRMHLVRRGVLPPEADESTPADRYVTMDLAPTFREEVIDACRFLFVDHMPLTVIVATMSFPLVVGLGGFLTASSNMLLFSAIALVPGLTVIGMVGALSRRIMQESSHGIDDAPRIPDVVTLFREGARFLTDALLLAVLFLGPAIAMFLTNAPLGASIAAALLGALLMPMAMVIRQVTNDWRTLSPNVLFRAIVKGGKPYFAASALGAGIFLPAATAFALTFGSQPYLQVSVVGPLMVAPLFVMARLLGRVFATRRDELALVIATNVVAARTTSRKPLQPRRTTSAPQAKPARPKLSAPSHPEAGHQAAHPTTRPATAATRPQVTQRAPVPVMAGAATETHPAATSQHAMSSRTSPAAPTRPTPTGLRTTPQSTSMPQTPNGASLPGAAMVGDPIPDLTKMPGFNVVTGKDRERAGAAAQTRATPTRSPAVGKPAAKRPATAPTDAARSGVRPAVQPQRKSAPQQRPPQR